MFISAAGEHAPHKPPVLKEEAPLGHPPAQGPELTAAQAWGRPQVPVEMVRGLQGWAPEGQRAVPWNPSAREHSPALLHITELPSCSCHDISFYCHVPSEPRSSVVLPTHMGLSHKVVSCAKGTKLHSGTLPSARRCFFNRATLLCWEDWTFPWALHWTTQGIR